MHKQTLPYPLPHPGDIIEGRMNLSLGAKVSVKSNAKAVRFVPDMGYHPESLRIAVEKEWIGVIHSNNLFQTLCKADHHEFILEPEFAHGLPSESQLPLTPIDDHELWQIVRVLCHKPRIATIDNLLHGSVVVGPHHSLNLKLAIILLGRKPPSENHARGDRIGTLDIGVVKALNMFRQLLHSKRIANFFQGNGLELVGIGLLELAKGIDPILLSILGTELKK